MSAPPRVVELRALAGAPDDAKSFRLRDGEVDVDVVYEDGSASSVTLRARYDAVAHAMRVPAGGYREGVRTALAAVRPMRIVLVPEHHTHRRAKAGGVDREVQTGDRAFDDAVYVDAPAPEDVVLQILGPDVRAGVLELFAAGFSRVVIDDETGHVVARCTTFPSASPTPGEGARAVRGFARLARGLPKVERAAGTHARHPLAGATLWLAIVGVVFLCVDMPAYQFFVAQMRPACSYEDAPFACELPAVAGVVAGSVLALVVVFAMLPWTKRFHGRSDSSSRITGFLGALALFVWCVSGLAIGMLAVLAGLGAG